MAEGVPMQLLQVLGWLENLHRAILVQSNPGVTGMINSLANADHEHQRELEAFARRRGVEIDGSQRCVRAHSGRRDESAPTVAVGAWVHPGVASTT
jgi:hypothetical protein